MGAQTDTLQWGHISCSLLYLQRSIGSLEQFRTRSRSSYERACWIGDFRFVFVFCFISSCLCTKLKQYSTAFTTNHLKTVPYCTHPSRVKSVQYAPKTDPKLKQYRTAPTPFASNHCSIFADPPLINNTNNCPIFPPALGSALFPFLPEICTLRQVANKLYGYIYSALATYFYAVIYLHHEDIDGHLLRQYDF